MRLQIADKTLANLLHKTANVYGDYAEIGVFKGATFKRLAADANARGIVAHAFDSFAGMDTPTDKDGGEYPKGKLSCGGVGWFASMMKSTGIPPKSYKLHSGFIPDCFSGITSDQKFRFAFVDLDQYQPTLIALQWVWPKMSPGSIVVCDDYFPGADQYASAAVDTFLRMPPGPYKRNVIGLENNQLMLRVTQC